jgi:hypothetical protein
MKASELCMSKYEKLLRKILQGRSDANIPFVDLCAPLHRLGFEERISGSHHIFRKAGIEERPNLQRDNGKAKVYQIRRARALLLRYNLNLPK